MQFSKTSSLVDIGHGLVIISEKRIPTQLNIMSTGFVWSGLV